MTPNEMRISGWTPAARSDAAGQFVAFVGWASFSVALQIFRREACVFRNTRKHLRTDLIGVVKREDVVRPAFPSKCLVRTRLTLEMPPDSEQSGEDLPGLRRRPLAHAGTEMLIDCGEASP